MIDEIPLDPLNAQESAGTTILAMYNFTVKN